MILSPTLSIAEYHSRPFAPLGEAHLWLPSGFGQNRLVSTTSSSIHLCPAHSGLGGGTAAPRVSVVVLNFNGREDLDLCLGSLHRDANRGSIQVLVADNGSSDGSVEWVARAHPWARVLALGKNWGFAGGVNRILRQIDSPFVALLNNDTQVEPGWIEPLVDLLQHEPDVAAVQARIMLYGHRHLIQSAGGGITSHGYGFDLGFGRWNRPPFDRRQEVFFASAGAALLRTRAWSEVGPFDPRYFMYHEDVDWSWRAWLAGWRVLYEPRAVVYHKMGATTSRVLGFPARQALGERHRIRTLLKLGQMPLALRRIAQSLRTRDPARARLLARCVAWNLARLPETLRMRARTPIRVRRSEVEARMHPTPLAPALLASYRPASGPDLSGKLKAGELMAPRELRAGAADEAWLGVGWHVPERSLRDGAAVRWMAEEGEIFAMVPPDKHVLDLELEAWEPSIEGHVEIAIVPDSVPEGRTSDGWRPLGREPFRLRDPAQEHLSLQIAAEAAGRVVRIQVTCPEVRASSRRVGDQRELGVGFRAYRWSTQ